MASLCFLTEDNEIYALGNYDNRRVYKQYCRSLFHIKIDRPVITVIRFIYDVNP